MSDLQREAVASKIRPYAGQGYILSVSPDQESLRFVRIVGAVLDKAGWVRHPSSAAVKTPDGQTGISAATEPGVRVQIAMSRSNDAQLTMRARVIADALGAEGTIATATLVPDLEETPDLIQVRVGSKPK